MPAPEKVERNADIVARWRANETQRSIARRHGISAKQVSKIIARSVDRGVASHPPQGGPEVKGVRRWTPRNW